MPTLFKCSFYQGCLNRKYFAYTKAVFRSKIYQNEHWNILQRFAGFSTGHDATVAGAFPLSRRVFRHFTRMRFHRLNSNDCSRIASNISDRQFNCHHLLRDTISRCSNRLFVPTRVLPEAIRYDLWDCRLPTPRTAGHNWAFAMPSRKRQRVMKWRKIFWLKSDNLFM